MYIGAGIGGLHSFVNNVTALNEGGPRKVSPFFIPMMIGNIATGNVAIRFKQGCFTFGYERLCNRYTLNRRGFPRN